MTATPNITIRVQGSIVGGTPEDIVKVLTPIIVTQLKAVQSHTTGPLHGK